MATYYALTARQDGTMPRTCALIPAASIEAAGRGARALRESGALAFVETPSRFRLRMATRGEISLLQRFLASCSLETATGPTGADLDGLLVRRQRLIQSFFLALYLDPRGLKERLRGLNDPGGSSGGLPGGSGGAERPVETDERTEAVPGALIVGAERDSAEIAARPADPVAPASDTSSGSRDSAGAVGAESQENALARILNSPEANDGGASRSSAIDLEDLF